MKIIDLARVSRSRYKPGKLERNKEIVSGLFYHNIYTAVTSTANMAKKNMTAMCIWMFSSFDQKCV